MKFFKAETIKSTLIFPNNFFQIVGLSINLHATNIPIEWCCKKKSIDTLLKLLLLNYFIFMFCLWRCTSHYMVPYKSCLLRILQVIHSLLYLLNYNLFKSQFFSVYEVIHIPLKHFHKIFIFYQA